MSAADDSALVAELERLSAVATPAPWGTGGSCEGNYLYGAVQADGAGEHLACLSSRRDDGLGGDCFDGPETSEACANASLIAALVTNLPAILTALRDDARQPADGWRPIENHQEPTAMSSGNGVLVACSDGAVGEAYFRAYFDDESDGWWWANTGWADYPEPDRPDPVAFRPLPEPPTTTEGKGA